MASRNIAGTGIPMKTCLWHWSVGSIFGGVAATVLFAVVWAARHGGDFGAL
jgi:hypothetical protein